MFVEDPYVEYVAPGDSIGRAMGLGEDQKVVLEIMDAVSGKDAVEQKQLVERTILVAEALAASGYEPQAILVGHENWFKVGAFSSGDFVPRWHRDCEPLNVPAFQGGLRGIPVVTLGSALFGHVLVVDFGKLGRWVQYQVPYAPGEIFAFHPDEIDRQKAEVLLDEQPDTLSRLGVETREDGIWLLRQKVGLRILERFEYVIDDPEAAVCLSTRTEKTNHVE